MDTKNQTVTLFPEKQEAPRIREHGTAPLNGNTAEAARRAMTGHIETAVVAAPENAALLAYRWPAPIELVRRILALEAETHILNSLLDGLTKRIAALESKR